MKALHAIVVTLIIIGALNWGLVGLADFNLVAWLFGADTWLTNLVYILVGISGLVAIFTEFVVHRHHHDETRRSVTAREPHPAVH